MFIVYRNFTFRERTLNGKPDFRSRKKRIFVPFSMVSSFCRRRIKNGVSVCIGYVVAEIGYAVLLR